MAARKQALFVLIFLLVGVVFGLQLFALVQGEGAFFVFQRPTYLVGSDSTISDTYVCDLDHDVCKVNFDFRGNFDDTFSRSDHDCRFEIDTLVDLVANDPCNPPSIVFPSGEHRVGFEIVEKEFGEVIRSRNILIQNPDRDTDMEQEQEQIIYIFQQYTDVLEPYDPDLLTYTCIRGEICRVNLDFRESVYNEENTYCDLGLSFDPDYVASDPCNPPSIQVPYGEHQIHFSLRSQETDDIIKGLG